MQNSQQASGVEGNNRLSNVMPRPSGPLARCMLPRSDMQRHIDSCGPDLTECRENHKFHNLRRRPLAGGSLILQA